MKKLALCALVSLSFVGSWATASAGINAEVSDLMARAPLLTDVNGIYSTQRNATEIVPEAVVRDGQWVENLTGESIIFKKGEPVSVEFQPNGDVVLQLLVDASEAGTIPQQILLNRDEFIDAELKFLKTGDVNSLNAEFSAFANTDQAAGDGGGAKLRTHGHRVRLIFRINGKYQAKGCLGYVLAAIGWNHPGGVGGASNLARKLLSMNEGWHRVDCKNPPTNAVGSWTGKHTAIWSGSCWRYDLACAPPGPGYGVLYLCVAR